MRDYLMRTSRIVRLDAKQQHINETLTSICCKRPQNGNVELTPAKQTPQRPLHKPIVRRKRIGRLQMNGQPKLFGGSLEEYLDATNQEIPLIIKSCIRVINLYGNYKLKICRYSDISNPDFYVQTQTLEKRQKFLNLKYTKNISIFTNL